MRLNSPQINLITRACVKASRSLIRDFGEIENLQVSSKGPGDFVSSADKRTEKIISILNKVSASSYISPPGAQDYLSQDNYGLNTNIPLSFIDYHQKEYSQKKITNFISNLSIIDVIANVGWSETSDHIKLKN